MNDELEPKESRWVKYKEKVSDLKPSSILIPLIILIVVAGAIIGLSNLSEDEKEIAEGPALVVTEPASDSSVENEKITVKGETEKNAMVTVNNQATSVDENGNFSKEVTLNKGENQITVIAKAGEEETKSQFRITRIEPVAKSPTAGGGDNLSKTGPETLFIPELSLLSLAGLGYYSSRKKLLQSFKKSA